ncbi:short transient receptor potential channel 3, partial [Biomphalaria glabrata]
PLRDHWDIVLGCLWLGNSQAPAIKEETNSSQVNGDSEITDSCRKSLRWLATFCMEFTFLMLSWS